MATVTTITNQYDHVTTQAINGFEARLTSLHTKVESKMRKITSVFRELCEVNASLNHLNRKQAFNSRTLNFFSGTSKFLAALFRSLDSMIPKFFSNQMHSKQMSMLFRIYIRVFSLGCYFSLNIIPLLRVKSHLNTKAALEQEREKQHNKLTQYDQAAIACAAELDEFLDTLENPTPANETILDKTQLNEEDPNILTYDTILSVRTSPVKPVGAGKTLEFIQGNERAQQIFERAMSSKYLKELYIEAMLTPHPETKKIGSWLFILKKKEDDIGLEFGAYCGNIDRTICIDRARPDDEALSAFIFELTNAVSTDRFEKLHKLALEGSLSREEYAEGKEAIEHEGALRHHAITTEVIKEKGWSDSIDIYQGLPADFESLWPEIKDERHTEFYREQWDRMRQNYAEQQQLESQSLITGRVQTIK